MITEKIEKILNDQIAKEGYSSNLYLSMASYAETSGYEGTANWLYAQAEEEKMHMLKFVHYVNARGGKAKISAMDEPPFEFGSIRDLFEKVFEHEQFISSSINNIVGACMDERDFTTHNWIQWFVTEQIEEEATVSGIIDKLNLLDGKSLYHFDRDLMESRSAGGEPL
jgi:ferritin